MNLASIKGIRSPWTSSGQFSLWCNDGGMWSDPYQSPSEKSIGWSREERIMDHPFS